MADYYTDGFRFLALISAGLLTAVLAKTWRYVPLAALITYSPFLALDVFYRATVFDGSLDVAAVADLASSADFWSYLLVLLTLGSIVAAALFAIKRLIEITLLRRTSSVLKFGAVALELIVPCVGLYALARAARLDLAPFI